MPKRGAEVQINKDNPDVEVKDQSGSWMDKTSMDAAGRKIIKARKRNVEPSATAAAMPKFNFADAMQAEKAAKESAKAAATATESKPAAAAAKKQKTAVNPLAKFMTPTTNWECSACLLSNEDSLSKCRACETPRPGQAAKAPPASTNPLAKFMAPSDNWECTSCLLSNEKSAKKCKACETPRAGGAADTTAGSSSTSTPATASKGPTFTFGGASKSNNMFTFGATTSKFTWGAAASNASTATSASSSSSSTPAKAASTASTGLNLSGSASKKDTLFKGVKPESSGEENDTIHHRVLCRAYILKKVDVLDSSNKKTGEKEEYREAGKGELHVNTLKGDSGKTLGRLILRVEKTHRLVMNAPIFKGMQADLQDEKFVRFLSLDLPVGQEKPKSAVFLLKVKNKASATELLNQMKKVEQMVGGN